MSDPLDEGFFPRYIDRPKLIGVFEIDEFMVAFGVIFFVITLSLAFPQIESLYVMVGSIVSGLSASAAYKKFKKNRPNGYTAHAAYKKGIYHPQDNKALYLKYPYLKKYRVVPFGFTKELIN
jgi:type IV conjugative transfer system protein TraL